MVFFEHCVLQQGNTVCILIQMFSGFSFPPLPRLFLLLAAAALVVSGVTACAPLENPGIAMVAPETMPKAQEQKAAPPALKQESPSLQEEIPPRKRQTPKRSSWR